MIAIVCYTKDEADALFTKIHWVNMDMSVTIYLDAKGYHFEINQIDC